MPSAPVPGDGRKSKRESRSVFGAAAVKSVAGGNSNACRKSDTIHRSSPHIQGSIIRQPCLVPAFLFLLVFSPKMPRGVVSKADFGGVFEGNDEPKAGWRAERPVSARCSRQPGGVSGPLRELQVCRWIFRALQCFSLLPRILTRSMLMCYSRKAFVFIFQQKIILADLAMKEVEILLGLLVKALSKQAAVISLNQKSVYF